jgi:hypothetical protein
VAAAAGAPAGAQAAAVGTSAAGAPLRTLKAAAASSQSAAAQDTASVGSVAQRGASCPGPAGDPTPEGQSASPSECCGPLAMGARLLESSAGADTTQDGAAASAAGGLLLEVAPVCGPLEEGACAEATASSTAGAPVGGGGAGAVTAAPARAPASALNLQAEGGAGVHGERGLGDAHIPDAAGGRAWSCGRRRARARGR